MADYRSDISPVEEYLLEQVEEKEGPKAASEVYRRLTGQTDTKPTPPRGGINDEDWQKLDHLWDHHMKEHNMRKGVTD